MDVILFFFVLTLCGVVFGKVDPFLVIPVIAPLALFKNTKNPFYLFVWCAGLAGRSISFLRGG
jgi:hypothetical protein